MGDFFTVWISNQEPVKKNAERMLQRLRRDFDQVVNHTMEMRYFPAKFISKKLIETFLAVVVVQEKGAEDAIEDSEEFLAKYSRDCPAYLKGFRYLLSGINLFVKEGGGGVGYDQLAEKLMTSYQMLEEEDKVALLAVKQFYLGLVIEDSFPQQQEVLQEMLKKNGEYYEWHYHLHRSIQTERRLNPVTDTPGSREIDRIYAAYCLAPSNPDVMFAMIHCLAEFLQAMEKNKTVDGIISFGTKKKFSGPLHLTKFLRNEAEKILLLDPTCLKFSIGVGSIFSSTLPHRRRDHRFAKQCFERALAFHPGSSQAVFRRGIFALIEERNAETALSYFEIASNLNPYDFRALTAVLLSYFQNRLENHETVKRILARQLASDHWQQDQLAYLYFIKGLHELLIDLDMTGDSWIKAFEIGRKVLAKAFELTSTKRKYRWPEEYDKLFSLPMLCSRMKLLLEKLPLDKLAVLTKVRTQIKKAGLKEETKVMEALKGNFFLAWKGGGPANDRFEINRRGEKPAEAYEILGVKVDSPSGIVFQAFQRIVFSRHPVLHEDLSKEEAAEQLKVFRKIEWAMAEVYF